MKRLLLSAVTATVAVLFFVLGQGGFAEGSATTTPAAPTQLPNLGSSQVRTHPLEGCNTLACDTRVLARDHRHAVAFRRSRALRAATQLRSMPSALASWFDDAGATASGTHYANGFAALIYGSRWGLAVRFCAARCAVGHLEDHGPYVGGRTFDLAPALKAALGCGDLCTVRYRALE